MNTLDLAPLLNSPCLPDIVATLSDRLRTEAIARTRFRDEMSDDRKVEFVDGEVVMHSPARNRHLRAKYNVSTLLGTHVRGNSLGEVRDEKCLCVFPRNDYEPDVVFFGPAKAAAFEPETLLFPVPDLVIEVLSDTTEVRDRGVKFDDYEAHGVGEYWIVDAEAETVEQYAIEGDRFQLLLKSGSGEIASRVVSNFRIPIRAMFDDRENIEALRRLLG
ncbi:MAG: Uma2 family endonuclease [Candidatus Saccharimonas sp.]|nr:Uma2 family endonuclease [Planctomycetaceae bacterium]